MARYLGDVAAIPDGASRGFDPIGEGRDTMFVVRRGAHVFGYRNACPHYSDARMAWRKDEFLDGERSHIRCNAHGALFQIEDGLCILGPCLGAALIPVNLDIRDGAIFLVGPYAPGRRPRAGKTDATSA